MSFTLRRTVFWLLDGIKGSKVRQHLKAIEKINKDHGSDFAVRVRERCLQEILNHCKRTVPYYRDLDNKRTMLSDFPVTNKSLIRENFEWFRSEAYPDKKTHRVTTSGSTGTPFTLLQDAAKKRRHIADALYFGETVGHKLGNRVYYMKIWNRQNSKSKLFQHMQNIVPIDVFQLTDERISALLETIKNDRSPKSVIGYSSALDAIVTYLKRNSVDVSNTHVISIIAMSETLAKPTKNALKEYFGCPVVSRYANLENGIFAQQTETFLNDFLMNLASYEIEILDMERDIPVKEGEIGRIVITDLFNRAMPMIRYNTGDIGIAGKTTDNGALQFVFKKIEGRKLDAIYNTQGELISSYIFAIHMWKYQELAQYQFIQQADREYEFKLNSPKKFEREKELLEEFRGYLGKDADIKITYVKEIPLLSSGKRRKVVNKLAENKEKTREVAQ